MPTPERDAPRRRRLSRRQFLRYGGSTVVGAGLLRGAWGPGAVAAPSERAAPVGRSRGPVPSLTTTLRRREDALRLHYEFFNLRLDKTTDPPRLVRKNASADAYVLVHLQPQNIAEQAFHELDPGLCQQQPLPDGCDPASEQQKDPIPPPVGARVAGGTPVPGSQRPPDGTRLAFLVPGDVAAIEYTTAGLLAWAEWGLPRIAPSARRSGGRSGDPPPELREPEPLETAIELPFWLLVSPHAHGAWVHATEAVTSPAGRTELWHTRLATRQQDGAIDEHDDAGRTVRAVWTRDPGFADFLDDPANNQPFDGEDFPQPTGVGLPFRMSLSPRDRYDIVVSTADWQNRVTLPGYLPRPVDVNRLMLTSLGAWFDAHGSWDTTRSGRSLASWRHRATMGRDHYVRIVRNGFLFPFGHGAALIKVTERKFRTIGSGLRGDPKRRIAYLFQRYFLVLRQRDVAYGSALDPIVRRNLPFGALRCATLVTPNLDPPGGEPGLGATKAFVPRVGGSPFLFQMVGTDRAGRRTDFNTPALFVDEEIAFQDGPDGANPPAPMAKLRSWYRGLAPTDPARSADLRGSAVAAAPSTTPADTDLELHRVTWAADQPLAGTPPAPLEETTLRGLGRPGFLPALAEAEIRVAAVEGLMGAGLGTLPVVVYEPDYVASGFHAERPGEVFVRVKDVNNPTPVQFARPGGGGDRTGGVAAPNLSFTGLSRRSGAISGDPDLFLTAQPDPGNPGNPPSISFNPAAYFGNIDATLLGDIKLSDVIAFVTGFDLSQPADFQDRLSKVLRIETTQLPGAVETRLAWRPDLVPIPGLFTPELAGRDATLELAAVITTPLDAPQELTTSVSGDLQHFQLSLIADVPFITLQFNRLRFRADGGEKPDVDVDIRDVLFGGPLAFVNELREYLRFGGGSGPSIELAPTQLEAGYSLPLPSITVGVFSLQNITLAAGITVPFTGQPVRLRFGFCSLENPFLLTVMWFAGGGYFELAIGADGVESLEAALEFGGGLALDVGVASGSVELMAGIYLAMGVPTDANPEGDAELTGYVRLKGQLRIMGVVTLTLTFKMSLTYIPSVEKAVGKASMVVEIEVLIFSGSVTVEVERRFGGSDDPTFGQALPQPSMWDEYCDAFAPIGAA